MKNQEKNVKSHKAIARELRTWVYSAVGRMGSRLQWGKKIRILQMLQMKTSELQT